MSPLRLRTRLRVLIHRCRSWCLFASAALSIIPRGAAAQRETALLAAHVIPPPSAVRNTAAADSADAARLLAAVQRLARETNPLVRAAVAQRDAAQARATATGFVAPATLTAGLSEAPNGDPRQGNVRLEIGRELFSARRNRAERDVAAVRVQGAQAALRGVEREVDASILREVVRVSAWYSIASRLLSEDQLLAGADESVRSRFAVGEARYVDVLRLRTERLRVQTERAAAESELRAGRAALAGLLGVEAVSPGSVVDSLVGLRATDTDGGPIAAWRGVLATAPDVDTLLLMSADVQLADVAVREAQAQQTLGIAQRRAQVSASAGVQRIGQANNGPAFGPSLGFTMSLPFTASRATTLALQAGRSDVDASEASRRATRNAIRARLLIARERLNAARERLSVFDAALLRGAREERESALAAYRSGGLTLLDFVDFERALARAEIDRVRALLDAADAYADLLTGGGSASTGLAPTLTAPDRR